MQSENKPNSNAILDTLETIPGYPETLKIYHSSDSSFYKMRCWMAGKMVTRTTKTRNKELAKKAAGAFYNELLLKRAKGEPLTEGHQFQAAYEALVIDDMARVERKEIKLSFVDRLKHIYKKDLEPFFKRDQLKNITYTRIQEFVAKLQERDISAKTIQNHLMFLGKILRLAERQSKLDKMPTLPAIQLEDHPRGWLDEDQYIHLIETIVKEIKSNAVVRYQPITRDLLHLSNIMVNSFLRPSDIKNLKNKDITVFKNNPHTYLRIQARGKVKSAAVVSMAIAVHFYEELTEFNTALGYGKPDDYVFFPALVGTGTDPREHAMRTIGHQFGHVLKLANLKTDNEGNERTLYSLRHTAIMFRLMQGDMSIYLLARNCRTSVQMIERFYGSHLAPEMKVAEIQSLKEGHD